MRGSVVQQFVLAASALAWFALAYAAVWYGARLLT
jgi:hypothetical protein